MKSYESFPTEIVKQHLIGSPFPFQLSNHFIFCAAMEQFFTPTRRLGEMGRDNDDDLSEYAEVQLAVPVEEFLLNHWDWEDMCTFGSGDVIDKVLWIGDMFLVVGALPIIFHDYACDSVLQAYFVATSGQRQTLTLKKPAWGDIPAFTREASVFWRAIMASNSVKVSLRSNGDHSSGLPSGPLLSQFLRESPSLQVLDFRMFDFKEEHCRALATLQGTNLKVKLNECALEPLNAEDTFIEWFRNNEVVTELEDCQMGCRILSALSGNNSVKRLSLRFLGEKKIRSLAQALPGNMGIEHLTICDFDFNNETWSLLFRSLSRHPRVGILSFTSNSSGSPLQPLPAALKTARMNAIIQMLRLNTVVHTIDLAVYSRDEEKYQNSILPRLEMNRTCFEAQRQAVKRADPSIRPQLLGRALHVVRFNPELVYLFLSENVPAFVRTEEVPIIVLAA
jgi:hypothetical protein